MPPMTSPAATSTGMARWTWPLCPHWVAVFRSGSTKVTGAWRRPSTCAVGRIDADATLDLAVLSNATDLVYLFSGLGDGTFSALGTVSVIGNLLTLDVADLTGDGLGELLVGEGSFGPMSQLEASLNVFENAGDGTFPSNLELDLVGFPANVVVGDLNGDGDPDLGVSSSTYPDRGSVYLGTAGLSFGPRTNFPTAFGSHVNWVAFAHMDDDAILDAVSGESDAFDDDTVVWRGGGDGTFTLLWFSTSLSFPTMQTPGDFNGDGTTDVVARYWGQSLVPLANTGSGGLVVQTQLALAPSDITAMVAADFDNDGVEDIAVATPTSTSVSVMLSRSNEALSNPTDIFAIGFKHNEVLLSFKNKSFASDLYWILGSVSGTAPGLDVGGVAIPLNLDNYSLLTLNAPNSWITDSFGVLDGNGQAHGKLSLMPGELPPAAQGLTLQHAFVIFDGTTGVVTYASDALPMNVH